MYLLLLCNKAYFFFKMKVNNIGMAGFVYITSGKSGKNGPSLQGRYNCARLSLMSVLLDAIWNNPADLVEDIILKCIIFSV